MPTMHVQADHGVARVGVSGSHNPGHHGAVPTKPALRVAELRDLLLAHFACRLVIFGFADIKKDPRRIREYASAAFRPQFGAAETFTLATVLRSQDGGAMQLSQGVGIAIVVEKTGPETLVPSADAFLRIDGVELLFDPRPRNDEVVV